MTVSRRLKRGCAVGLPLVAVGLIAGTPRLSRTEIQAPAAEDFGRVLVLREATIAGLMKRVDELEERVLRAELLQRAGTLAHAVAATVVDDQAEMLGGPSGRPAAGPPPALIAALAEPAVASESSGGATAPVVATDDGIDTARMARLMPATMVVAAPSQEGGPTRPFAGWVSLNNSGPASDTPAPPQLAAMDEVEPTGGAREALPREEDVDGALRALERVLVQEGGLLLPEWAAEVDAEFSYSFSGSDGLRIADGVGLVDRKVRRDTVKNTATFRLGLPWDSQVEVGVPYVLRQEQSSTRMGEQRSDGTGLGDVEIGLTHQLLRERGPVPDVLAAVQWKTPTGGSSFETGPDELAVGSGFHAVSGTLTAVKSQEPLVFFGSLSYTANLPDRKAGLDIDPGDAVGLSLGTILAAGPGTSLRSGLDLSFSGDTEVDGRELPGSNGVSAVLKLGASAVLPFTESRSLLSVTAGVGVTEDAPDLQLKVSMPYRF